MARIINAFSKRAGHNTGDSHGPLICEASTGFLATVVLGSTTVANAQSSALSRLAWLSGCWASEIAEAGSVEQWTLPAGGTLLGISRTVREGKTIAHEFLQIREAADGKLVYIAFPSGQKETTFPMVRLTDGEVVFENPEHDFPQRIIYRRNGNDRLVARIEGIRTGTLRSVDFPMKRIGCEAPVSKVPR